MTRSTPPQFNNHKPAIGASAGTRDSMLPNKPMTLVAVVSSNRRRMIAGANTAGAADTNPWANLSRMRVVIDSATLASNDVEA